MAKRIIENYLKYLDKKPEFDKEVIEDYIKLNILKNIIKSMKFHNFIDVRLIEKINYEIKKLERQESK